MRAVRTTSSVECAPRSATPEMATVIVFADRDRVERCVALLQNAGFGTVVGPFFGRAVPAPELLHRRFPASVGPVLAEPRRERYAFGDVRIDVAAYEVLRAGVRVPLSALELDLLVMLARARGAVVAISDLQRLLRPTQEGVTESHALRTHVSNLRRKLELEPRRPRHLLNVRRRGYRLAAVRAEA